MPLYEYLCKKGHRFEKIQKFSDKPIKKCPECGAPAERVISAPAVQFKGSGWYITDYARKSGTVSDSPKSDSTDKSESKTETKTESKTEAKTESKTETKTPAKQKSSRK
jgi:putative FmdB family regulatory protein